jgi:hypothetical protein
LPTPRTDSVIWNSRAISWPTAARVQSAKIHLQLLGALVRDQLADMSLLIRRQAPALAPLLAALLRLERRHAARLVEVDRPTNGRPAQMREFGNLHHAILLLMQTNDLLAPSSSAARLW